MKEHRWALKLVWVVLAISILFFGARLYYRLTDDFRVSHIRYDLPHNEEWDTPPLTVAEHAELKRILSQPFTYIGKGAQSYAFLSADGQTVIKFFKFKHLKPNWLTEALPDNSLFTDYKRKKGERKERLLKSVFNGYKLAYDQLREETGLVAIHLNRTKELFGSVTLVDKIGRNHRLDLDPIVFVIQKSVRTTRDVLTEALQQGDLDLAKRRLNQMIGLFLLEYSKGIYDRDHGVMHNTGFHGEDPIHLDVGKLTAEPKMKELVFYKPDLMTVSRRTTAWLEDTFPEYAPELSRHIEKRLSDVFQERD